MHKTNFRYGVLVLIALFWVTPAVAKVLVYSGMTAGSAKSSSNTQFDATDSMYLFVGIQTDYYVTYEVGATRLHTKQATSANNQKNTLGLLTVSALGHLPISDSSLFARIGFSAYEYGDNNDKLQRVLLPIYGAGIDLGIIPRLTIRLEWQHYVDLKMNDVNFDVKTIQLGAFYYF